MSTNTTPSATYPSLKNKVALVTGGTSGIGLSTALALAKNGAHVVLTGRREKEGREVAAQISKFGVKGVFVQGDVSKEADIERAVAEALKINGRLDLAFNNAGVEFGGPIIEATEADYRRVFDTNVLGVLLSLKHEFKAMAKTGGSIVNTSSVAGRIGMPGAGIYIATKHAVNGLSKTAALEGTKLGIRVNIVSPAAIETDMLDRFAGKDGSEMRAGLTSMHPIGRIGKPQEIADAVLYLLSDQASFVTGHDLLVDGGLTVP